MGHAATKTHCSQINKFFFFLKEFILTSSTTQAGHLPGNSSPGQSVAPEALPTLPKGAFPHCHPGRQSLCSLTLYSISSLHGTSIRK